MSRSVHLVAPFDDGIDGAVGTVSELVAQRLIDAIEQDETDGSAGERLASDERRQQLLIGGWINEALAVENEGRLGRGLPVLDDDQERSVRARVVADLTGAGPLEPYLG